MFGRRRKNDRSLNSIIISNIYSILIINTEINEQKKL